MVEHNHRELFGRACLTVDIPTTIICQLHIVAPLVTLHHIGDSVHQITIDVLFIGDFFVGVKHSVDITGVVGRDRLLSGALCVLCCRRALTELTARARRLCTQIYRLGRVAAIVLHVWSNGWNTAMCATG